MNDRYLLLLDNYAQRDQMLLIIFGLVLLLIAGGMVVRAAPGFLAPYRRHLRQGYAALVMTQHLILLIVVSLKWR